MTRRRFILMFSVFVLLVLALLAFQHMRWYYGPRTEVAIQEARNKTVILVEVIDDYVSRYGRVPESLGDIEAHKYDLSFLNERDPQAGGGGEGVYSVARFLILKCGLDNGTLESVTILVFGGYLGVPDIEFGWTRSEGIRIISQRCH